MSTSPRRLTSSPREGLTMTQPGADEGTCRCFLHLNEVPKLAALGQGCCQCQDFQSASSKGWQIKLIRQICRVPYQQGKPLQYHWQKYLPLSTELGTDQEEPFWRARGNLANFLITKNIHANNSGLFILEYHTWNFLVANEHHYTLLFSFFLNFLFEEPYIWMNLDLVDDFRHGNWMFSAFKSQGPACQMDCHRNGDLPLPKPVQLARCGTGERQAWSKGNFLLVRVKVIDQHWRTE